MESKEIIEAELDNLIELIDNRSLEIQKFTAYSPLFKSITQKYSKKHLKPRTCIYPNCNSLSIKRSHSISKGNSLKLIADQGHVLQPVLDVFGKNFQLSMETVGVNKASTFPGYCEIHEKVFQQYENLKLDEESFVNLQAYRSICREIVYLYIEIDKIQEMIETYDSKMKEQAFNILRTNLKRQGIKKNIDSLNIKANDIILNQLIYLKKNFEERIIYLKEYSVRILNEYFSNSQNGKCTTIKDGIRIDHQFPVALCGYTSLAYGDEITNKKMLLIANIIPFENCTYVLCSAGKEHESFFRKIIDFYFQTPLTLLSFIESVMIHSSDHWFIKPSYWDSFSQDKKSMILSEILNVDKLITDEFEYSIFDDIRESILSVYIAHEEEFSEADRIVVEKEKNKLTNICGYAPPTEDYLKNSIEKYWNAKFKIYA